MFRNLFHVLSHYKTASLFNVLGLGVAFFSFIFVLSYHQTEFGFDRNISDYDSIYKLENQRDDKIWDGPFARPMAETILRSSPEVLDYCYSRQMAYTHAKAIGFNSTLDGGTDSRVYSVEFATPNYPQFFGFDMVAGSVASLSEPGSAMISETMSKEIFGAENPVGKYIYIPEFKGIDIPGFLLPEYLVVGGVYRDFPENTRLTNSVYIAINDTESMDDWSTTNFYCFVKFGSRASAEATVDSFKENNPDLLKRCAIDDVRVRPLSEVYFGQPVRSDSSPTGSKSLCNVMLLIGILVIIVAMLNYICFSVALAPIRTKSVVIRKVLGNTDAAIRAGLVFESTAITLLSYGIAVAAVCSFFDCTQSAIFWAAMTALTVGFISGLYPALYISKFPAISALNGTFQLGSGSRLFRKCLIGFQFVISIALVSLSIFIVLQNRYLSNFELGFDKEGVLEVDLSLGGSIIKHDAFRTMLLQHPEVKDLAFTSSPMVADVQRASIGYRYNDHHSYMSWTGSSYSFPELFDLKLICGRFFEEADQAHGSTPVCVINETAAEELLSYCDESDASFETLLGTVIMDNDIPVEIVGVFKDYHYESLYKEIVPMALWTAPDWEYRNMFPGNTYVKYTALADARAVMKYIREAADILDPGYPVDIQFLDSSLEQLYEKSHKQGHLVVSLSIIAVILSLVGVFGMAIFEAKRMRKEIAVRKVLGATVYEIIQLFSIPVIKVEALSAIMSIPLAYYGVSVWLKGFAYSIGISWWVFALALLLVTAVTLITIVFQNYKAATQNPTEVL